MIISHSKKFVFFKTRKTASSSLQNALSTVCDPTRDIITGSNTKDGILDESYSAGWNMDRFITNHPHPTVSQFNSWKSDTEGYFKFVFVRNPFEVAVSRYHWDVKGKKGKKTSITGFRKWVKDTYINTFQQDLAYLYVPEDVSFIGRYENLDQDYLNIQQLLNIELPQLKSLKSGYRKKEHYSRYYDAESIKIISTYFKEDLERFNYKFEFQPEFTTSQPTKLITPELAQTDNINGPTLIKNDGKYMLYFAHHQGKGIRAATSTNVEGPYKTLPDVLELNHTPCKTHIASPDVHVRGNMVEMYYHGDEEGYSEGIGQRTYLATSKDGLVFKHISTDNLKFYFREFTYLGDTYGIAKNDNNGGIIYKRTTTGWQEAFTLLPKMRHASTYVDGNNLYIFYTLVGEVPESIYLLKIEDWTIVENYKIKAPELDWEGVNKPQIPSKYGRSYGVVNQLRDPFVYKEDNQLFLLYSYGGESGIAICKLNKSYEK